MQLTYNNNGKRFRPAQNGKVQFGYIYGFGISGTVCLYFILNLLS